MQRQPEDTYMSFYFSKVNPNEVIPDVFMCKLIPFPTLMEREK